MQLLNCWKIWSIKSFSIYCSDIHLCTSSISLFIFSIFWALLLTFVPCGIR
uniref:Uncharacterized protein n=1 Tax=Rhizophora mucronata TaxID=61149 RepID=A0A2P2NRN1_RHIMU